MDHLGIDLAKLTFDATVLTSRGDQHYHSFPNTPEGFTQLQAWLTTHGVTAQTFAFALVELTDRALQHP